ncbi:sodium-coupled neutral amino acid transporter 9 [Biomphalaria glabrata]|uniref:Sodium-coupled neutral amino acid transporter 9 homolog n=1 Tax=Biomphalaria glabrata TaxID=6526 RepID=A0A9W3ACP1_BIOGL|nr:sodium-coupled neutral amino acid transporter 9 homolog [Biomphalaria glabrata]XP_055884909.1 sodium-coupled neutral amino acid transporter 9 homolog [Biomphalaria glabrata]KAI8774225.1 sodium-coupled neutral amino acid transporter 9 [Biomphalaria glabrata]
MSTIASENESQTDRCIHTHNNQTQSSMTNEPNQSESYESRFRPIYSQRKRSLDGLVINNDDSSDSSEDERSRLLGRTPHTTVQTVAVVNDYTSISVQTGNQHSIVTIFSMWNTMMGTSLLSMPWTIKQAGFINGIVLLVLMAGIMAYTTYRVLKVCHYLGGEALVEFSDAVKCYLGRITEGVAILCSLLTLLGGCIVYWILMSNFLYHIGIFIYSHVKVGSHEPNGSFHSYLSFPSDATCYNKTEIVIFNNDVFAKLWDETKTIPLYLILLIFPFINFKSPTFFTKFNSFGTLSVIYLIVFVLVKAGQWGMHIDINKNHDFSPSYSPVAEWSFPALTGVAALAYLLQNAVISIVRNQKYPENNTRDLLIAYCLVCITYTLIGAVFYASFPLHKSCIEDNFLNNIASVDIMAFVARIGLFFQMLCVLPLLTFIIRAQLLHFLFRSVWPSLKHVVLLNIIIVALSVVFAVFLPSIGHIISFVGGFCGFSYAIALPCAVYLVSSYQSRTLSWIKITFHGFLIFIGFANFVAQFVIIGHTK